MAAVTRGEALQAVFVRAVLTGLLALLSLPAWCQQPTDLYAQSASTALNRSFPSPRIEYILLDLKTHRIVATRWANADVPIPVGSLLKPFVALAYGQMKHVGGFPAVRCHGKADGCWKVGGHGSLTLEHALAQSCNAYFLALARALSVDGDNGVASLNRVSSTYGLPDAPAPITPQELIGITADWRVPTAALAYAYAKLAGETADPLVRRLLAGMRLAVSAEGTASKIGSLAANLGGVLAKTGTAPCRSDAQTTCIASGDGLVVVLTPAEEPQQLLLVRELGTTGAQTAVVAGRMLTQLEALHAQPR